MLRCLRSAAAFALAFVWAASANATVFTFSETVGGYSVTGSFSGLLNGNVISNLTNASVFVNGAAFIGNGSLYIASYSNSSGQYASGSSAVASLDGSQNNFVFYDANSQGQTNDAFYSINGSGSTTPDTLYYNAGSIYVQNSVAADNFRAVAAAVPEPASWCMMIVGFGIVGYGMRRRQQWNKSIA